MATSKLFMGSTGDQAPTASINRGECMLTGRTWGLMDTLQLLVRTSATVAKVLPTSRSPCSRCQVRFLSILRPCSISSGPTLVSQALLLCFPVPMMEV